MCIWLCMATMITAGPSIADRRHLSAGLPIPGERYCDQPYVVRTDDGAWLCVMTTASGSEGSATQTVLSMRSDDRGVTWSKPVPLEPPAGPEASYAVLLKVPYGRIYCFYNHNTDNVREVKREDGGTFARVDSLGHYVFRYSDDHGRSWSERRYDIPVREFECDRRNAYGGALRFFWNVGRPVVSRGSAFLTLHKVGAMGAGFFAQSEGCILRSDNILSERDPGRLRFETLPKGDTGLRTPAGGGRVAEEQSLAVLSDGSLFCVYRTVDGHPACAYSRDRGETWTAPRYLRFSPGGRLVKHPRAANFVWKCGNGKYLYWFHNHGPTAQQRAAGWDPYADRNPAWLSCAEEADGPDGKLLAFSEPEIVLYDDDPFVRISYPDLIEDEGRFWITETQKSQGRIHAIDGELLSGLFGQATARGVPKRGLIVDRRPGGDRIVRLPRLPDLLVRDEKSADMGGRDLRGGLTIEFTAAGGGPRSGVSLLDSRDPQGRGIHVTTAEAGAIRFCASDGQTTARWDSDPDVLAAGRSAHVTIILDAGPKLILFVVNGAICDGGEARQFGWGRFSPNLRHVRGADSLRVGAPASGGPVRMWDRALRVSEAIALSRARR